MKRKLLALQICAAYFIVLFLSNLGPVMWGTLGVIRPGDVTDGKIDVEHASTIISSFARSYQLLTLLVGIGAMFLIFVTAWLLKASSCAKSRENHEGIP
jgi:hypothetical protein